MTRLAVLTTHPIQYQAPWFRALHACPELELTVLFGHRATPGEQSAAGFGVEFDWDVPLLDGYPHRFLRNVASPPSVTSFKGVDTPEIVGLIRDGRFDAVLVNGWHYKAAWQAFAACWLSRTPVMARGDSHLHTPRRLWKSLAKRIAYRRFIPRFNACLAVGGWSRDYFLAYGAKKERIFLAPHVVDGDWVARGRRSREQVAGIRRSLEIPENAFVFLFVGKFLDLKRPTDFLRALMETAVLNANVWGLMVGDGPMMEECRSLAEQNRVRVRLAGFLNQSRLPEAYQASDVLVVPSSQETWGMVVDEAMAFGRPCLVSDGVGCAPDRIRPGETGFLFPSGDVAALADGMKRFCALESDLEPMRRAALAMSAAAAPATAARGVLQALESVVAGRRRLA